MRKTLKPDSSWIDSDGKARAIYRKSKFYIGTDTATIVVITPERLGDIIKKHLSDEKLYDAIMDDLVNSITPKSNHRIYHTMEDGGYIVNITHAPTNFHRDKRSYEPSGEGYSDGEPCYRH